MNNSKYDIIFRLCDEKRKRAYKTSLERYVYINEDIDKSIIDTLKTFSRKDYFYKNCYSSSCALIDLSSCNLLHLIPKKYIFTSKDIFDRNLIYGLIHWSQELFFTLKFTKREILKSIIYYYYTYRICNGTFSYTITKFNELGIKFNEWELTTKHCKYFLSRDNNSYKYINELFNFDIINTSIIKIKKRYPNIVIKFYVDDPKLKYKNNVIAKYCETYYTQRYPGKCIVIIPKTKVIVPYVFKKL